MKEKKLHFIITRVTATEKEYLVKMAKKENKRLSKLVRVKLGLENNE